MSLNDFGDLYYPQSCNNLIDLNYYTNTPILIDDTIIVKEENHLKYNKYNYEYSMSTKNKNTTPNIDGINNLASLGINLVGSFIDTATPIVKEISDKMKEYEEKVYDDVRPNKKELISYRNEDDNNIYFVVELPRVRKEDCEIKYLKNESVLLVVARTEPLTDGFSFIENKELQIKLPVPDASIIDCSNIIAKNKNGALYITISKNLINIDNININILD